METIAKPTSELSIEELQALLRDKTAAENKKKESQRVKYESDRDDFCKDAITTAYELAEHLKRFKAVIHNQMDEQATRLQEYGQIRGNSKGGFSVTDSTGTIRIIRRRDTDPLWDERAIKGVELIKDFLADTVKKRDQKLYEILIGFIERNNNGDLEYAKVMDLIKHEDKFTDERWVEGLRLVKEGYSLILKSFAYEFKVKTGAGKWENLVLNFSSL